MKSLRCGSNKTRRRYLSENIMKQGFIFCLFWFFISSAYAFLPYPPSYYKDDITIGDYELVDKVRLTRKTFKYTYKVKLINISGTKLKAIEANIDALNIGVDALQAENFTDARLSFGTLEEGQTKQSIDTFSFKTNRSEPIDITTLIWQITYKEGHRFTDSQNNEITFFLYSNTGELSFTINDAFSFSENQNPANLDLNQFSIISNNFIEISFFEDALAFIGNNNRSFDIEIKYTESPYRLLMLRNGDIEWATFVNNKEQQTISFRYIVATEGDFNREPNAKDKIAFALIRRIP